MTGCFSFLALKNNSNSSIVKYATVKQYLGLLDLENNID